MDQHIRKEHGIIFECLGEMNQNYDIFKKIFTTAPFLR